MRKLAVIRNNDDTKCPFGLTIADACKTVGNSVLNMKVIDPDEPNADDLRQNILNWMNNSEHKKCVFAAHLFKGKSGVVDCNFDQPDAGISSKQVAFDGSPYYSRIINDQGYGTGMGGLLNFPETFQPDSVMQRNLYYGLYGWSARKERLLQRKAKLNKLYKNADNSKYLDDLLKAALAGSKDSYQIFLDALEEINPILATTLRSPMNSSLGVFYHLPPAFPHILRRDESDIKFLTPTIGGMTGITHSAYYDMVEYPSFEFIYDKDRHVEFIKFKTNLPTFDGNKVIKIEKMLGDENLLHISYNSAIDEDGEQEADIYNDGLPLYKMFKNIFDKYINKAKSDEIKLEDILLG